MPRNHTPYGRVAAYTLVEMLVVIFIVVVLAALVLPAVQSSRGMSEAFVCQSNLHQLAVAVQSHRDAHKWFPTGGHGWKPVGDPNLGFGAKQPGGWNYSLLPYLDERSLYNMGKGLPEPERRAALAYRAQFPVSIFYCPSRRPADIYPAYRHVEPQNAAPIETGAKSDYAACAGTRANIGYPGPTESGEWLHWRKELEQETGVCFIRSRVRLIPDGESHTYLIGEKYLNPDFYDGQDPAGRSECSDDQHAYMGFDFDINRWTWNPKKLKASFDCAFQEGAADDESLVPRQDTAGYSDPLRFGSAHPGGCYFAFADGHVEFVSYNIDPLVHKQRGSRNGATR